MEPAEDIAATTPAIPAAIAIAPIPKVAADAEVTAAIAPDIKAGSCAAAAIPALIKPGTRDPTTAIPAAVNAAAIPAVTGPHIC